MDPKAIKDILQLSTGIVDIEPLVVYIMRNCGCTFADIGKTIGKTRQGAYAIYKNVEGLL